MAVAYEAAAAAGTVYATDLSFNPGAGSLVLGFARDGSNDPTTISAVYDSVSMTPIGGINDGFMAMRAFYRGGQASGAKTFLPTGGTFRGLICLSASGADEADPIRAGSLITADNNEGDDDQFNINVSCQVGDLVVACLTCSTVTAISWTGATERAEIIEDNAGTSVATVIAASTTVNIVGDFTVGFNRGAIIAFAIKPSGGGVDLTNKCRIISALG